MRKWRERYTAFVARVAKVLTYAFWGNNSGSKQLARKPYNWCRPGWTWRACWRERCRSRRCGKLFWTGGGADTTSGVGPSPWTHRGGKLKHFSTHLWKACTCFWWWRLRKVQKKEKRSQQLWGKEQGWGFCTHFLLLTTPYGMFDWEKNSNSYCSSEANNRSDKKRSASSQKKFG